MQPNNESPLRSPDPEGEGMCSRGKKTKTHTHTQGAGLTADPISRPQTPCSPLPAAVGTALLISPARVPQGFGDRWERRSLARQILLFPEEVHPAGAEGLKWGEEGRHSQQSPVGPQAPSGQLPTWTQAGICDEMTGFDHQMADNDHLCFQRLKVYCFLTQKKKALGPWVHARHCCKCVS